MYGSPNWQNYQGEFSSTGCFLGIPPPSASQHLTQPQNLNVPVHGLNPQLQNVISSQLENIQSSQPLEANVQLSQHHNIPTQMCMMAYPTHPSYLCPDAFRNQPSTSSNIRQTSTPITDHKFLSINTPNISVIPFNETVGGCGTLDSGLGSTNQTSSSDGHVRSRPNSNNSTSGIEISSKKRSKENMNKMLKRAVASANYPEAMTLTCDPNRGYCLVPSRLSLLGSTGKYCITIGELFRRAHAPECLNLSYLGGLIRKAKDKDAGETMRRKLAKYGINILAGRRRSAASNSFTALCEGEANDLVFDFEKLLKETLGSCDFAATVFAHENFDQRALFSAMSLRNLVTHLTGIIEDMDEDCTDMVSPRGPENPYHLIEANVIRFSRLTHGFGNRALVASWRFLNIFLKELCECVQDAVNKKEYTVQDELKEMYDEQLRLSNRLDKIEKDRQEIIKQRREIRARIIETERRRLEEKEKERKKSGTKSEDEEEEKANQMSKAHTHLQPHGAPPQPMQSQDTNPEMTSKLIAELFKIHPQHQFMQSLTVAAPSMLSQPSQPQLLNQQLPDLPSPIRQQQSQNLITYYAPSVNHPNQLTGSNSSV